MGGGVFVRASALWRLCHRLSLRISTFRAQMLDSSDAGTLAPPSMQLSSCLLDSNSAVLDGGAVSLLAGAVTISAGAISSNAAGGDGGGVSVKVRVCDSVPRASRL